jgi:hypothetical protein
MRAKRMSKTVLVEEVSTPDRRAKTLPPCIQQPKINLRYLCYKAATSLKLPNKTSQINLLNCQRIR